MSMRSAAHEVHIWGATLAELGTSEMSRLSSVCGQEEMERSARFVFEKDRCAYLAAHGLLRVALTALHPTRAASQWMFQASPYGRPEIVGAQGSALRFNLSHCPTRVVCVVCEHNACGIDVEPTTRVTVGSRLLLGCLSAQERRWVESAAPDERTERFLRLWTLKEAISKALGLGLRLPFAELDLDVTGRPEIQSAPCAAKFPFRLAHRRTTGGHVEALALIAEPEDNIALFHHEWPGREPASIFSFDTVAGGRRKS